MQGFLSCFPCGGKQDIITNPKPNSIIPVHALNQSQNMSFVHELEDEKSRSTTSLTFRTAETAYSKDPNDQRYLAKKIQYIKNRPIAERQLSPDLARPWKVSLSSRIYLKQWSEEYTYFLKNANQTFVRSVDNSKLTDNQGNLLDHIKQRQNYFLINEKVWKFIKGLYGGGPELKRDMFFPVYMLLSRKLQIPVQPIQNPLNLCYMISVIQSLLSIQQLNYYLFKKMYLESSDPRKKIYHNLLYKVWNQFIDNKDSVQQIKDFSSNFETRFNPYQQHDAQQFLLFLFDRLQQEMKVQGAKLIKQAKTPQIGYTNFFETYKSITDKIFAGQQQSTVICLKCEKSSIVYVPFLEICLEMADSTLDGCLKKHFSSEKLQDLYECQFCNKKTKAIKQTSITKTPNYLLIALKKFTSSGRKNEDRIKYTHELDIEKHCIKHHGETKYILSSIIVHKGTRINKGHYYCYTRRNKSDWYYCNDDLVKKIESMDALGRDAYLLFYERIR